MSRLPDRDNLSRESIARSLRASVLGGLGFLGVVGPTVYAGPAEATPAHTVLNTEKPKGLAIGSKLTDTRLIVTEIGEDKTFNLKPRQLKRPEDLCVIYTPGLDPTLNKAIGDHNPNHSAAFLFTAEHQAVDVALVIFDTQTEEVVGFGPAGKVKGGERRLLLWFPTGSKEGLEVYVDSTGNASDQLDVSLKIAKLNPGVITPSPNQPNSTLA